MRNILISGCGDIGYRVAAEIRCSQRDNENAIRIYGLIRRSELCQVLQQKGIEPVLVDLDCEPIPEIPSRDSHVYHFVPPPATGQTDPRTRALLNAFDRYGLPAKLILLSTTAVYGDCQGDWVDETTPVNPQTDRGKRRLDAELMVQLWAKYHKVPYVILRVSGIYGAGRLPIDRIKQGMVILREDQSPYSNRIHQDDLAVICVAAADRAPNAAIYNVSDGQPSTMSHYFKTIARSFGLPTPIEIDREQASKQMSVGMLSYLRESRRISNKKLLQDLAIHYAIQIWQQVLPTSIPRVKVSN